MAALPRAASLVSAVLVLLGGASSAEANNGVEASECQWSPVAFNATGTCTAVLVGSNTLLTAAHCISDPVSAVFAFGESSTQPVRRVETS